MQKTQADEAGFVFSLFLRLTPVDIPQTPFPPPPDSLRWHGRLEHRPLSHFLFPCHVRVGRGHALFVTITMVL